MTRDINPLWGVAASLFGCILIADYSLAQFEVPAYLALFSAEQQAYFLGLPPIGDALWVSQAVVALIGGLGLWTSMRTAAIWLALAFGLNLALSFWLMVLSEPPMQTVTGLAGPAIMGVSVLLSLIFWLAARRAP